MPIDTAVHESSRRMRLDAYILTVSSPEKDEKYVKSMFYIIHLVEEK